MKKRVMLATRKNRVRKWPVFIGVLVFGISLATIGVGQSSALGDPREIARKPTPKWNIPFEWDPFSADAHFKVLCSKPQYSVSWVCQQLKALEKALEREERRNERLESKVRSLEKKVKKMESLVSVLDTDRKHRLEKERRREEKRKARRKAREERRRKRKEQEAERERQQRKRADERYRWQKHCENGPKKFGMPLNFNCRIP